MKDISTAQITRVQREITEDKLKLIIHLGSLATFRAIELPEQNSLAGVYKARSIYNIAGQSIKIFFYPPPHVNLSQNAPGEPQHISPEDSYEYFPA